MALMPRLLSSTVFTLMKQLFPSSLHLIYETPCIAIYSLLLAKVQQFEDKLAFVPLVFRYSIVWQLL